MFLQAASNTAANAPSGGSSILSLLMSFILMFLVFYFLLIRPQQKRNKIRAEMLRSLKKGDKITTIGGLHGTIETITDDIVVLKVNENTRLTFDRSAVNTVISSPNKEDDEAEKKTEKKPEEKDSMIKD
jgi:preprotein translocase subunit YajC